MVRTRFAPSPTGLLHIGNARTALFNCLHARKNNGRFILRIEDTDRARSTTPFELSIFEDLRWLGLEWDEGPDKGGPYGPYRQSERVEVYRERAERLLSEGKAYRCFCSKERLEGLKAEQIKKGLPPRYDGRCRDSKPTGAPADVEPAIRFRVPVKLITFTDGVHGPLTFDSTSIGDFIIVGSDGMASYNFAAVVDDSLMEVSDIIRGDDHLSNAPRQILLFEALGLKAPRFSHMPLVVGPDSAPLSKRHGVSSIRGLRDDGFLPEAVVNATARLGWAPGEGLLTLDDLSRAFSLERLSKSPSAFDMERLKAYNKAAIMGSGAPRLLELASIDPGLLNERVFDAIEAVRPNASTLKELKDALLPFSDEVELGPEAETELKEDHARKVITAFRTEVEKATALDEASSKAVIESVKAATGEKGRRLLMPLRLALTGNREGIELVKVMELLGRSRVLERLKKREEG